jgi:hypothetical protein
MRPAGDQRKEIAMERFIKFKKYSSSLNDLIGSMAEALSSSPWGTEFGKGFVPAPVRIRNGDCIRHLHGRKASFQILTPDCTAAHGRKSTISRPRPDDMKVKRSFRAGA